MKTINKFNQMLFFSRKSLSAAAGLVLAASVGCTSDKSLDAFRQEKSDQYAAQYAPSLGTWVGKGTSQQGNSSLGAVTLDLSTSQQVQPSSDGLGNETRTVLVGHLNYQGVASASIKFNSADFQPNTSAFKGTIPVVDESGVTQTITVDGKIQSGTFVGDIYLNEYKDFGMSVVLTKDGNLTQTSFDDKSLRVKQLAIDDSSYVGPYTYTDPQGATHSTTLRLQIGNAASNPQQQFLRLLNPQRIVTTNLSVMNYRSDGTVIAYNPIFVSGTGMASTGPVINLTDADSGRSAKLAGFGPVNGYTVKINCAQQTDTSGDLGWLCSLTGNSGASVKNVFLLPSPGQ